jgi:hypothetical protein
MPSPLSRAAFFIAIAGLLSSLSAQRTIQLPSNVAFIDDQNIPIAGQPMRYQQWFPASEWLSQARHPVRVRALAFRAGTILAPGTSVDVEVRIGLLPSTQLPSSTFSANLGPSARVVLPRTNVTLPPNPPNGQRLFTVNFPQDFVWDGQSSVIIDFKVFGNGNGNQAYLYHCQGTSLAINQTERLFAIGHPDVVQTATIRQNGVGLLTDFDFAEGTVVPFGTSCPGGGGVHPVATSTGGLPVPPNATFGFALDQATPSAPSILFLGDSKTSWNGAQLPIDLALIGAHGCSWQVSQLVMFPVFVNATGQAAVPLQLQAGLRITGLELFGQWFVLTTAAPNGFLASARPLWIVFG